MAWMNLPKKGPDSWQGMRVALRCMGVMAFTGGISRSFGVVYVGIRNHFGASREEAAWPLSVLGAFQHLIGIAAGPLAQAFSPEPVILCASILIIIGLLASFFASSLFWLTISLGVVYGSGVGMMITPNVIFVQQYFKSMRGLALGLNYSGSTIAGFVFPPLISFLLEEYALKGTLLIIAGISMNILVINLIQKEAPWLRERIKGHKNGEAAQTLMPETVPDETGGDIQGTIEMTREFTTAEQSKRKSTKDSKKTTGGKNADECKPRVSLVESLSVLRVPKFFVVVFTAVLVCYSYDASVTTIVDYMVDHNIPLMKATTIIPMYSFTDMMARLLVPQLGDRDCVNKEVLMSLLYGLLSVSFFFMPAAAGDFLPIAALAMFQSAMLGSTLVMWGVLMAEAVGTPRLPMAYGINGLCVGAMFLTKPYFVGYFRDRIGDYTSMYKVCGVVTGVGSLCWAITWYVHKVAKRKSSAQVSNSTGEQIQATPEHGSAVIDENTQPTGLSANDPSSCVSMQKHKLMKEAMTT